MLTADLTGALLAEWVARAAGYTVYNDIHYPPTTWVADGSKLLGYLGSGDGGLSWAPHESWAQGGPLIPAHQASYISILGIHHFSFVEPDGRLGQAAGPTLLIAAMRAFVASKFGPEVQP